MGFWAGMAIGGFLGLALGLAVGYVVTRFLNLRDAQ